MARFMLIFLLLAVITGIMGFSELTSHYASITNTLAGIFIFLFCLCLLGDLYNQLEKNE